jgi:hypothetical protein
MRDRHLLRALAEESHTKKTAKMLLQAKTNEHIFAGLNNRRVRFDELDLTEGCHVLVKCEKVRDEREFICRDDTYRVWVRELTPEEGHRSIKLLSPFDIIEVIRP